MKKFLCLFVIIPSVYAQPKTIADKYTTDYEDALEWIDENQLLLQNEWGEHAALLTATVFPEIMRYSWVQNLAETTALELAYVSKGSQTVDFSIGRFQIKPSFVERLIRLKSPQQKITTKLRQEILDQLQTVEGQIQIIKDFHDFLLQKYGNRFPVASEKQLLYLAAHYNGGLGLSEKSVLNFPSVKKYPWGNRFDGEQDSYFEVALFVHQNHAQRLWK